MIARSTPIGVKLGETTVRAATIATESGRTWCHCPSCRQKLAEITGDRLVIAKGPVRIIVHFCNDQDLVCWRCHETVTVRAAEAKAA